ncbi:hypothetical protein K1719_046397 [Acacia pycnantha]|nr:hypothetical protein K1719_046397 [Acacia pycnantha]
MDEIMNSNICPNSQNEGAVLLGDSSMLCFGEAVTENFNPHIPLDLNIEGTCDNDDGNDVSLPSLNEIQMTGNDGVFLPELNEVPMEFEEELSTYTEIAEPSREYSNTSLRGEHGNGNSSSSPWRKRKFLTNEERKSIGHILVNSIRDGMLMTGTTKKLASMYCVSRRVIQRIWQQIKETREASHRKTKNCGRKRVQFDEERLHEVPLRQRTTLRSL